MKPVTWPRVRAMIQLGSKYQCDAIHREGMIRLMDWHPKTIELWDTVDESSWRGREEDCIPMANLAEKLGFSSIRAIALYRCCQLPLETLHTHSEPLSPDNLQRCSSVREELTRLNLRITAGIFDAEVTRHERKPVGRTPEDQAAFCHAAFEEAYRTITRDPDIMGSSDPLVPLSPTFFTTFGLCKKCDKFYRKYHNMKRGEILKSLRALFRL